MATREELQAATKDTWNALCAHTPRRAKAVDPETEGRAVLDEMLRLLSWCHINIVRQAMKEELYDTRAKGWASLLAIVGRCRTLQWGNKPSLGEQSGKYDRSGICKYNLLGDRSAFANHVCESDPWEPEFFRRAAQLLEEGMHCFGEVGVRLIPLYRLQASRPPPSLAVKTFVSQVALSFTANSEELATRWAAELGVTPKSLLKKKPALAVLEPGVQENSVPF